jgi:hypothetical protein
MRFPLFRIGVRDMVVLLLVAGSLYLAIVDPSTRSKFADLVQIGIGGYLAQLIPKNEG